MNFSKKYFLLGLLFFSLNLSAANTPQMVDMPLSKTYVPVGFDDNDRIQVMVLGVFPDTCYRVGPHEAKVDTSAKTVTVKQTAYRYPGPCLDVTVPFAQVVEVGLVPTGTYNVKDAISGTALGNLQIHTAKVESPDDYLYAPVGEAVVRTDTAGKNLLSLSGNFSTTCMKLKDVQVYYYPEIIVVQPVAELLEQNCSKEKVRFQYEVALKDGLKGIHLLHVRSIDGQAVNKLVELQ